MAIKKREDFKDLTIGQKLKESIEEFRQQIFIQQKYNTELKIYSHLREKIPIQRITNRPRVGTPRVKQLDKLE